MRLSGTKQRPGTERPGSFDSASDRLALAIAGLVDAIRAELRAEAAASDQPDRLLSIDEAARMLGIGRSRLYAEIGAGHLRSVTSGRRRLVPSSAITDYIERAA